MRLRQASLVTLLILVCCSWFDATSAQTRRRGRAQRKRAPSVKYEPLTEIQKAAITELLNGAEKLEITYQYDPSRYYDESSAFAARGNEVGPTLPDGEVKNAVSLMVRAYADAGYLSNTIYPHRETERERNRREVIEALERLEKHEGKLPENYEGYRDREASERNSRIASILRFYGIGGLTPYQAREYIFTRAQLIRRLVEAALPKIPTLPKETSNP